MTNVISRNTHRARITAYTKVIAARSVVGSSFRPADRQLRQTACANPYCGNAVDSPNISAVRCRFDKEQGMRSIVCSALLLSLASICIAQNTPTSDEDAIRKAATEWSQSANLNSLDKWMTFYAEDASVLPFNAPLVKGKNNTRQYWAQLFSKPGWHLSFVPTKTEIESRRNSLRNRYGRTHSQ